MEAIAQQLLNLLAAFGLGILLVLGAGFYLHYQLKRDAQRPEEETPAAADSKSES